MMKKALSCIALVALALLVVSPPAQAGKAGVFEWQGGFEVGVRIADVNGNENKYRQDVDVDTGPRVFNLDITGNRPGDDGFFDLVNVYAHNMGEPAEFLGVALKKFHKWNFRYSRKKFDYFYNDIILPVALAGDPAVALAGDFHSWDVERTMHDADFDFRPTDRSKIFFNFDRFTRRGDSTTTEDISRDEFELDEPIHQNKDEYKLGAEFALDKFSLYGDFTYRDYEESGHKFLPGYSAGEDPEDATELLLFERLMPSEFTMPQITIKGNIRPDDDGRVTLNAGYVYAKVDSEFALYEEVLGTAYNGNPLDEMTSGGGDLERKTHLFDIDGSFGVTDQIDILGAFRYRKLDQIGASVIGDELTATAGEISTWNFDVGARVAPSDKPFTFSGGLRFESRDVEGFHEVGTEDTHGEDTDHVGLFLNFAGQIHRKFNLVAEYEYGDYDNPFTLMSPTSLNRFKVRARGKLHENVDLVASYLMRRLKNDISDANIDTDNFGVDVRYRGPMARVWGGVGYTRMNNEITNTLSTGVDWMAFYASKVTSFKAGIEVDAHQMLTLGFNTNIYTNSGDFELTKQQYNLFALVKSVAGYNLRFGYERHDYNEDAFDWDDYDANIFTIGVGYGFGQ